MIKVSRFYDEMKLNLGREMKLNLGREKGSDTQFPYWERVKYFDDIDDAYKYYTYCRTLEGCNCVLTISDGAIEHTVLSHYTDDFPEQMKKNSIMCNIDKIMSIEYNEKE